jgi:hypothetical protein
VLTGKGGCFGDGPGELVETSGQLSVTTSNMLPAHNYSLCLQVFKDTRVAHFEQQIVMLPAYPPGLTVRYVVMLVVLHLISNLLQFNALVKKCQYAVLKVLHVHAY